MRLTLKPDPHQMDAAKYITSRRRTLLAYATGTGKSLCQIIPALWWIKNGIIDRFLFVVTPNGTLEVQDDFKNFGDHCPKLISSIDELKIFLASPDNPVGMIKYGLLDRVSALEIIPYFQKVRIALSFDEFHKLKNRDTVATQAYYQLMPYAEYVIGATATAITSKLEDLYWLIDFLIPGFLGTFDQFADNYIERQLQTIYLPGGAKRKVWKILRYKNLDELHNRLSPVMITFYPHYEIVYKTLSAEMDNMDPYLEAAQGVLEVTRRGAKSKEEDWDETTGDPKSHSARMQDVQYVVNNDPSKKRLFRQAILDQVGRGVLVYCSHHDTIILLEEILTEMGIQHDHITGKVTSVKRRKVKSWFCDDPKGKVLLITQGGGQTLNLQATNRLIFYDLPYGIGNYVQVLGRVARFFSHYKTFEVTYIVMSHTVDEYKTTYIEHNAEPIAAVLKNQMGSKIELPSYNDSVLTSLRQEVVWLKKKRGSI